MKFYYLGKLMRTSKNHMYTHAVVDMRTGECIGCRANEENAHAIIRTELSQCERSIANCRSAIKALRDGKSGYYEKEGRRTWYNRFSPSTTEERYTTSIERIEQYMDRIKRDWCVVELEAR